MRRFLKLAIVVAVICALGAWVINSYPLAAPIREGTSADFWNHACHMGTEPLSDFGGFIYAPRDGWFLYYSQGIETQPVYRVEESRAMADFPAVVATMESRGSETAFPAYISAGIEAWRRTDPTKTDARLLLTELLKARRVSRAGISPEAEDCLKEMEEDFEQRWNRAQRYWLTALFEFGYLAALIVFLAIPWVRGAGRLGWAMHLGPLPILVMLPWYLGYLPLLFTSAFPAGGIVYPSVVFHLHGFPWTDWDTFLVSHAPKILEPLSQGTGLPLALCNMGGLGPIAAIWTGALLAVARFVPALLRQQYRNLKAILPARVCVADTSSALAIRTVARIYGWMGAVGTAVYVVVPTILFHDRRIPLELASIESWSGILLVAAFLTVFATSLYVSRRLMTRPQGIETCARWIAIILATAFFPILTLPCVICIRTMNRHFAAYCAAVTQKPRVAPKAGIPQ